MTDESLEQMIRRAVREELSAARVVPPDQTGRASAQVSPSRQSRARGDEGTETMDRVLAFLERLDPEKRLTQAEAIRLVRAEFPELGL